MNNSRNLICIMLQVSFDLLCLEILYSIKNDLAFNDLTVQPRQIMMKYSNIAFSKNSKRLVRLCYKKWTCQYFRQNVMLVLLPITIDRLIAVVAPIRYRVIMTRRNSLVIVAGFWVPSAGFALNHWIRVGIGNRKVIWCNLWVSSCRIQSIFILECSILFFWTLFSSIVI